MDELDLDAWRESETEKVVGWRLHQLLQLGFAPAPAERLAANPLVDLHQVADYVARGCPLAIAAQLSERLV